MKFYFLTFITLNIYIFTYAQSGAKIYNNYCVGCHAFNLKGTNDQTNLDRGYKPGIQTHLFLKSKIENGVPNTTMIPWKDNLTENEISAVVNYILTNQNETVFNIKNDNTEAIFSDIYRLNVSPVQGNPLKSPWAIEFISQDSALISEKAGALKWMINDFVDPKAIIGVPQTYLQSSTGGFMDIALDPDYSKTKYIYLAYSYTNGDWNDQNALALTKIVRAKIVDNVWTEEQDLFEVPDSLMVRKGNRWGCRMLFDDEGHLFFSIGDMGKAMDSQDLSKATGKVFRICADGGIPMDNPFPNAPGALKAIYSLGNRNVQGIAQDPITGEIWASEHGPRGGDELNILQKGHNYGWPLITYGIDYNGEIISEKTHMEGMDQPIVQWTPSIAVCPIEFVDAQLFPLWKNNLLVGALAFQELRRLEINNNFVTKQEIIWKGKGRVRDIKFGINGALYIITNGPDKILKVLPD